MTDEPERSALPIEIVRGALTDDELAALMAVVGEAWAAEADAAVGEPAMRSRWELSARALRAPHRRDAGWGGFAG